VDVLDSFFELNYAENSGGAINWDPLEPSFEGNSYSNNTATLYGNDIASFPQKIIQISEEEYYNQLSTANYSTETRLLMGRSLDTTSSNLTN